MEKGKRQGNLTYNEIMNALQDIDLTAEQIDEIYERFSNQGIDICLTAARRPTGQGRCRRGRRVDPGDERDGSRPGVPEGVARRSGEDVPQRDWSRPSAHRRGRD